jgi:hypothetical protein
VEGATRGGVVDHIREHRCPAYLARLQTSSAAPTEFWAA